MPGCSAKRCGKNSSKKDQFDTNGNKITFHQFPSVDKRYPLWHQWVQNVRLAGKDDLWKPNHNAKLCSLHFEEKFLSRGYTKDGKRPLTILADDALPTLFAPVPTRKRATQPRVQTTPRANARTGKCAAAKEFNALVEEAVQSNVLEDGVYALPEDVYTLPEDLCNSAAEQIIERIAGSLNFLPDTCDIISETNEDGILQTFFTFAAVDAEEQQSAQAESKSKMVTLPDTEGGQTRIILPNLTSVLEELPPLPPPLPEPSTSETIQASTSKVVTRGAQPFNAEEQDNSDHSAVVVAGTSSSDDACCSDQCRPFDDFEDMACGGSLEGDGKGEGSPGSKLTQALEMLQSLQVDLIDVLPPSRLKGLCQMLEDLSLEGNALLREMYVAKEQIRACKRINKQNVSKEEEPCPSKKDLLTEEFGVDLEDDFLQEAAENFPGHHDLSTISMDDWQAIITSARN